MSEISSAPQASDPQRQRWMSVLAQASATDVATALSTHRSGTDWSRLRGPETGLVMVRGRAGGTGQRFNVGEMTVTRCSVRLDDGTVGHAWVAGRNRDHAEQAAVLDAILQRTPDLVPAIVEPLARQREASRELTARKAAATRVDFFTLVRGED